MAAVLFFIAFDFRIVPPGFCAVSAAFHIAPSFAFVFTAVDKQPAAVGCSAFFYSFMIKFYQ
jgi:hypothetical protein